MGKAIATCFRKYAVFSGRASRSEFWFFYLFYVIFYFVGTILGTAMIVGSDDPTAGTMVTYLFIIPFILPLWSAGARRMHDVGKSGWFILVPIYNIILAATKGQTTANKYGEVPA